MASADPHTVKAFDDDLEEIRGLVCSMGGLAEIAIAGAAEALMTDDQLAAARIVAGDGRIDRASEEVERQCVRLIALRAPKRASAESSLIALREKAIEGRGRRENNLDGA